MKDTFIEIKLFEVKPEKINEFEELIIKMKEEQSKVQGCISINYMQRLYTIDGVVPKEPPIKINKICKFVKYFSYWEFDTKENYGLAVDWYFRNYMRELSNLLVTPFDINIGESR